MADEEPRSTNGLIVGEQCEQAGQWIIQGSGLGNWGYYYMCNWIKMNMALCLYTSMAWNVVPSNMGTLGGE